MQRLRKQLLDAWGYLLTISSTSCRRTHSSTYLSPSNTHAHMTEHYLGPFDQNRMRPRIVPLW